MEFELSFGQKAAGLAFNPSQDADVQVLKERSAAFIDACNALRETTENAEKKRMYSIAITDAQAAQMWAVKAATWPYPDPKPGSGREHTSERHTLERP